MRPNNSWSTLINSDAVQRPNWSAHADTQQQVAAARQVLRAGGLERYLS